MGSNSLLSPWRREFGPGDGFVQDCPHREFCETNPIFEPANLPCSMDVNG